MAQAHNLANTDALVLVALGANTTLGGQSLQDVIEQAIELVQSPQCHLVARSRLYHTPCFPAGAGPDYINGAIALRTTLAPKALLERLHSIEQTLGRQRVQRWGNRTMDLDMIDFDGAVMPDADTFAAWRDLPQADQINHTPDRLILPHPRLADRAFVLIPLMDIAPDWTHPVSGLTVRQMTEALPDADKQAVQAIIP